MEPDIKDILKDAETVAIIGCSNNKYRTSYHIASYLQEQGFNIIPIHPEYDEVLGENTYASIKDLPGETTVDIVDIFRDPAHTAEMVDEIIEWSNKAGQKPVVWTQLGVSSEEAKEKAANAGLSYVEEKCLMVEHKRLKS
ncbi:CoA-binding protein [Balneolaceae bacterium YR4-1]|uniref:CoA-binding protein n=1 Tax=Halalkalibaculum roseum TaxID=2709311 RepID=A0A6M1STN7_9BACT|nr:CoA-binding protein [Halalkalibaculum roseum]NGP76280.1 CoA-binding protein [Halalkalibaculum roseum]